jgi:hypothetical protein
VAVHSFGNHAMKTGSTRPALFACIPLTIVAIAGRQSMHTWLMSTSHSTLFQSLPLLAFSEGY